VGKQFVSMAVMMLVEEGKVNLTNFFPGAPQSWRPIKVKNLLSHTSGLAEHESDERTKPGARFYCGSITLRASSGNDRGPTDRKFSGEKWACRSTNYVRLGMLIHKVKFYLAQRTFKPLGMNATSLISEADIIYNRAAGCQIEKGELKNQRQVGRGSLYRKAGEQFKPRSDADGVQTERWQAEPGTRRLCLGD
jgi:CubicO group peptidase (beta-lactamase class C family)